MAPFGYLGVLQFEASPTGGRPLLRAVVSGGTDIDAKRHRIRPKTMAFRQDEDGIYENVDPRLPASPVRVCGPGNPLCFFGPVK